MRQMLLRFFINTGAVSLICWSAGQQEDFAQRFEMVHEDATHTRPSSAVTLTLPFRYGAKMLKTVIQRMEEQQE